MKGYVLLTNVAIKDMNLPNCLKRIYISQSVTRASSKIVPQSLCFHEQIFPQRIRFCVLHPIIYIPFCMEESPPPPPRIMLNKKGIGCVYLRSTAECPCVAFHSGSI